MRNLRRWEKARTTCTMNTTLTRKKKTEKEERKEEKHKIYHAQAITIPLSLSLSLSLIFQPAKDSRKDITHSTGKGPTGTEEKKSERRKEAERNAKYPPMMK